MWETYPLPGDNYSVHTITETEQDSNDLGIPDFIIQKKFAIRLEPNCNANHFQSDSSIEDMFDNEDSKTSLKT